MADQLGELCGKISLTKGESEGIKITEGEVEEVRVQGGKCLTGRIWMVKKVNNEAFKSVLSQI
jgi:hypothetical protein